MQALALAYHWAVTLCQPKRLMKIQHSGGFQGARIFGLGVWGLQKLNVVAISSEPLKQDMIPGWERHPRRPRWTFPSVLDMLRASSPKGYGDQHYNPAL